jgi:hypothetical protein
MSKKSENSTDSKTNEKEIALLFLTYENIVHRNNPILKSYLKRTNVYIHPKYPEKIIEKYKKYIIPINVETSWGSDTIVIATLLLLAEAYKNPQNKWFILCSEDIFPLKTYNDFVDYLGKQPNSLFSSMHKSTDSPKTTNRFKTQQWWAMKRSDVELLLNALNLIVHTDMTGIEFTSYIRNESLFKAIKTNIPIKAAMDELFFLAALKTISKKYLFTDAMICYTKWFNWVAKHPTKFNQILPSDQKMIDDNSCFFIRKTFPTFTNTVITPKKHCIIFIIGTDNEKITDYSPFISKYNEVCDFYLLVIKNDESKISSDIQRACKQCYFVVFSMFKEASNQLKTILESETHVKPGATNGEPIISKYKNVVIIPEELNTIEEVCNYAWDKYESKTHNRSYWYNKITGITTWVKPSEWKDKIKNSKGGKYTMKNRNRNKKTQKKLWHIVSNK